MPDVTDAAEDLTGVHRQLIDVFSHLRIQSAVFGDAGEIVDALMESMAI